MVFKTNINESKPGVSVFVWSESDKQLDTFLESFINKNTYHPVEVIVVKPSKQKSVKDVIKKYSFTIHIRCEEINQTFASSIDDIKKKAIYPNILLINSDRLFEVDFLYKANDLLQDENVCAVAIGQNNVLEEPSNIEDGRYHGVPLLLSGADLNQEVITSDESQCGSDIKSIISLLENKLNKKVLGCSGPAIATNKDIAGKDIEKNNPTHTKASKAKGEKCFEDKVAVIEESEIASRTIEKEVNNFKKEIIKNSNSSVIAEKWNHLSEKYQEQIQMKDFVELSNLCKEQNDYENARLIIEQGLKVYPNSKKLINSLVELYIRKENWSDAEDILIDIIRSNKGNFQVKMYDRLAYIYRKQKKYHTADKILEKAIKTYPKEETLLKAYANTAVENKDIVEAIDRMELVRKNYQKYTQSKLSTRGLTLKGIRKCHVCLLSGLFPPYGIGGSERSVLSLARGLAKEGLKVTVISQNLTDSTVKEKLGEVDVYRLRTLPGEGPNVYDDSLLSRRMKPKPIQKKESFRKQIINCVEEINPDIVHTNVIGRLPEIWESSKKIGLATTHTIRNYNMLCHRRMMIGTTPCMHQCRDCFNKNQISRPKSVFVDGVVAISEHVRDVHFNAGWFSDNCVVDVIPNTTDIGQDALCSSEATKINIQSKKYCFGYIGRIHKTKGVEVFLDAMLNAPSLAKQSILIAGEGNSNYISYLSEKYSMLNIRFIGFINPKDFFAQVKFCIIPSLWYEPFGRVYVESLGYGVPVIGSVRGGGAAAIEEGLNGFLFEPGETDLKQLLLNVSKMDSKKYTEMSNKCIAKASNYSEKVIAERYIDHYESVVSMINNWPD